MPSLNHQHRPSRFWDRLHIEIAAGAITLSHTSGILSRRVAVVHKHILNPGDRDNEELLAAQLQSALTASRCRGMNTSISLADTLVRMWVVTPPGNAASMADCRGAAALRFHSLYGEFASDWEMAADWDARRPFLASALRRSLLQRVLAICAEFRLTVLRLDPHFVTIWNRYRKELGQDAWIAIVDKESLTLGATDSGRLLALRKSATPELHSRAWLDQHLQREALLLNLNLPKTVKISGVVPPQWLNNEQNQIQCQPLGVITGFANSTSLLSESLRKGAT